MRDDAGGAYPRKIPLTRPFALSMRLTLGILLALSFAAPAQAAVTMEELRVPMRDGTELAVDLYRPDNAEGKLPVIVTLTPYHALYKGLGPTLSEGYRFTDQGYAFALVDVRGTYESGGCWDYGGLHERQDGYDLVEFLGTQPWSNGKVGMIGTSYDGTTANAAAVERPPHLATIVPMSSISRWYGYAFTQGVRHAYSGDDADSDPPSDTPLDFQFGYGFLPPPEGGSATAIQQIAMRWTPCDRANQLQHGYATQPDYDDFWRERDYLKDASKVDVPVLVTHGLQDYNVRTWEGTQWYEALKGEKAMVLGQWAHASPAGKWPDWEDFLDRWFGRWLKDERNGIEDEANVIVQSTDKEFRRRDHWAGYGKVAAKLGTADANFLDDGTLTESEMLQGTGGTRMVRIQFPDLKGINVMGRGRVRLRATSDQASTHFVAVLLDVDSGGTAAVMSRGYLNARYRRGLEKGSDLEPGRPDDFEIELVDKDHIVAEDHHVELLLASSSTTWVVSDERRANNTLHLAESELVLPIDGPAPPAPIVGRPAPAAPSSSTAPPAAVPAKCKRRATVRLPRGAKTVRVRVNGRHTRGRVSRRRLVVTLPATSTGRAVVRVTMRVRGRRVTITRRARTCRG